MVFFCLNTNPNLNLKKHFVEEKTLHLKPLFVFPEAKNETVRMKKLHEALVLYCIILNVFVDLREVGTYLFPWKQSR